jgi:hypothetical protein
LCFNVAFWGEEEIQIVANMGPAKDLPNIWPTCGLIGFEMNSPWHAFLVGVAKLIAISFTVAGGLRGGTPEHGPVICLDSIACSLQTNIYLSFLCNEF